MTEVLAPPVTVPDRARGKSGEPGGPTPPVVRGRILVVGDNTINQRFAERLRDKRGDRADVVANGQEAVLAFESIPHDLILMDCQMPEMDGFEAARDPPD